jgi:hypothetical protein
MKRLLLACILLASLAGTALADSVQLDDSFEKANKWLKDNSLTLTGSPGGERDDSAAFTQEALMFYGEAAGNPQHVGAQREMMAKRAAVVIAQRALLEYMEGFALVSKTSVKDCVAESDQLKQAVSGFVKGAQVVFQEYNKQEDKAVAVIKIGLHGPKGFATAVYDRMSGDPKIKEMVKTSEPAFKAKPVPLDEMYDGLVIDATAQNFRPALINRIFSAKGEVLYDPAKVSQKVLIEQGCGEYTNSVDKAKAALESRGVKHPLVVKASGVMSPADLQVADDDAVTIFSANQKGNFMAAAKVAFVLQ